MTGRIHSSGRRRRRRLQKPGNLQRKNARNASNSERESGVVLPSRATRSGPGITGMVSLPPLVAHGYKEPVVGTSIRVRHGNQRQGRRREVAGRDGTAVVPGETAPARVVVPA